MMDYERMAQQLVLHEGLRTKAYRDTEGYWTVGVGYNLSARGTGPLKYLLHRGFPEATSETTVTAAEATTVLHADIERVELELTAAWPYYTALDEIRQRVALDMAFNLGIHGAANFRRTRHAVEAGDYEEAVNDLYMSKWAHQVGDGPGGAFDRCDRLATMLRTGEDYTR